MLPPDFVIASTLKVGVVYKIKAPELINTTEPHFFVVVAINNDDNFLIISTTKLQNKIDYLTKRGFDLNTLAYIRPNDSNGLTKDSYFNCNDYFILSKQELISKVKEDKLSIAGNFDEDEYNILLNSIDLSEVNDIPKFLLKFS